MMRVLARSFRSIVSVSRILYPAPRSLHISPQLCIKEIVERQEGDTLVVEGILKKSTREDKLVKWDNEHDACPLCTLGVDVKHTDILIIKQFINENAKLYPRNITGLCRWQQRRMQYLVEMATRAGLINSLLPPGEPIPAYQRGWRKFNTYYEESEIPPSKFEYAIKKSREFEEAYKLAKAEKDTHEEKIRKRREIRRLQGSSPLNHLS